MFDRLRRKGFDIATSNHAEAILSADFKQESQELIDALQRVTIPAVELIASGGGEARSTQRLRRSLSSVGWEKHNFRIETTVDGQPIGEGTSHEIDHVRKSGSGMLALEIEWNNKDPFFDRDLENFQRLHAQTIISVGIIVTRGASLQDAMLRIIENFLEKNDIKDEFALREFGMKSRTARQRESVEKAMVNGESFASAFSRFFVADKFGMATTHWSKLMDRIARGVGNPCPLLLIGLPENVIGSYSAATLEL